MGSLTARGPGYARGLFLGGLRSDAHGGDRRCVSGMVAGSLPRPGIGGGSEVLSLFLLCIGDTFLAVHRD